MENLALRQQLSIYHHSNKRLKIRLRDRLFWILLSRYWKNWKGAEIIVKPVPIRRATHDGRCVLEKSIWEASAVNLSYKDKFFPLDMQHLIFHHQGTIDTLTKRKGLTGTGSM